VLPDQRRYASAEDGAVDTEPKTPLFNGALECRLYEFRMVAGSNRR
jgi:hypothetical protein